MEDGNGVIVPQFWRGEELSKVDISESTIDCGQYDTLAATIDATLSERMKEMFERTGLVVLKNTRARAQQDMSRLSEAIISDPMIYTGGANSRKGIMKNVYETGAPKVAHLHYHHEMAYVGKSTTKLAFCCSEATPEKGWTFVSDQVSLTKAIMKTALGQKLKDRGLCYVRCLTDRDAYKGSSESTVYNHWQRSFGTEDPEEAISLAKERGLVCEWGTDPTGHGGRYLVTKFYISAFEYCPFTDSNIMYSSVADDAMWFDSWPGVQELPNEQRPLKLLFGDDTEFTKEEFRQWVDIYDEFGTPVRWEQGDVAIVCNWRWAHGRPGFSLEEGEKRSLGVILGEAFDRVGERAEKW